MYFKSIIKAENEGESPKGESYMAGIQNWQINDMQILMSESEDELKRKRKRRVKKLT